MPQSLEYLEGKKLCVVFVRVLDKVRGRVRLQCFRGRANIDRDRLNVVDSNGAVFPVPSSATHNVLPNDGTRILGDADYFVLVKTDEKIEFISDGNIESVSSN
jgi:hypothetical protein